MLSIEELNKKTDELYEQDTILINQVNGLFKRTYELMNRMLSLENTVSKQYDTINDRYKRLNKLISNECGTKVYRVIWKSGHTQVVTAFNSSDAYKKVTNTFTGMDKVIDISIDGLRD
jgi:Mg2+ and Co2+ transporter CorA